MGHLDLKGMGVALITPFKTNGEVDFDTLQRLVDMHVEARADYLVALGTTAETPTLSSDEQQEIMQTVVKRVAGRMSVILGVGGNCTAAIVRRLKTENFTGIDGILSVVPYYNRPSQEGIFCHYRALSEATSLPIVLYNVPARTGVNMTAATTLRIARECRNIAGIKEASGNMSQIGNILRNRPQGFQVVSGDDGFTLSLMSLGAEGVISVIGNAFPAEFGCMTRLALAGDFVGALAVHRKFADLFGLLSVDGNPAGIKSLMSIKGLAENVLRLPLVPATEATLAEIKKAVAALAQ
jgi:4-hydroxy-tetrahydrodipicolinate synthase